MWLAVAVLWKLRRKILSEESYRHLTLLIVCWQDRVFRTGIAPNVCWSICRITSRYPWRLTAEQMKTNLVSRLRRLSRRQIFRSSLRASSIAMASTFSFGQGLPTSACHLTTWKSWGWIRCSWSIELGERGLTPASSQVTYFAITSLCSLHLAVTTTIQEWLPLSFSVPSRAPHASFCMCAMWYLDWVLVSSRHCCPFSVCETYWLTCHISVERPWSSLKFIQSCWTQWIRSHLNQILRRLWYKMAETTMTLLSNLTYFYSNDPHNYCWL